MSWSGLDEWWLGELAADPTYERVVTPLLVETLQPRPHRIYLDIGCGEGRVIRTLRSMGAEVVGVELSHELAVRAGPGVVVAEAPPLPLRDDSVDGIYLVLVLEHLPDHRHLFAEAARVVGGGGTMALVMNHPVWTAPGSTPISDSDGEILWRPGAYFSDGATELPAGDGAISFHHRTMASLLSAAVAEGWCLQWITEHPHHDLPGQEGIPRLLACRWRLLP
ncbi:MAG: class I SAM-dependent methyltransferase [Acidimicrobiia bacterium]